MDELITKQQAIDIFYELWGTSLTRTVEAIKQLPSEQPEPHYDEWCDSCKEYDKEKHSCPRWNKVIKNTVDELKSAQPEIIQCKDCKHSEHWYRDKRRCFLWHEDGIDVFDDGFCNYAERRTDGTD